MPAELMPLTRLLGRPVHLGEGAVLGRLIDVTVTPDRDEPTFDTLAIGHRGRVTSLVDWADVDSCSPDGVRLHTRATLAEDGPGWDAEALRLARDVLDTQIVDLEGKRLSRVAEVLLAGSPTGWRVAAVEVGAAGVWRRLGMGALARRMHSRVVDWDDLGLTSTRGGRLQLAGGTSGIVRLEPAQLAEVVSHLPVHRAVSVLAAAPADTAADALAAAYPRFGARLLRAMPGPRAAALVDRMAPDDAAALLRALPPDGVAHLLTRLDTQRAATLGRLLEHRADTAGGLMNTEVRTAPQGTPVKEVRDLVAADPPELEGLAVVFLVDDRGRPVGAFAPTDLLAGRAEPAEVPSISVHLPVDDVIDIFALRDDLALPVVDDEGVLVGSVAVDDVLEELLAQRLPGHSRFGRLGRRRLERPRRTANRMHRDD